MTDTQQSFEVTKSEQLVDVLATASNHRTIPDRPSYSLDDFTTSDTNMNDKSLEAKAPSRILKVAAAQVGPVHRWSERAHTLQRLIRLLENAAERGAQFVLFPEIAFTTFFPRYFISDEDDLKKWFEVGGDVTKSPATVQLFRKATELKVDICVGYAERTDDGHAYNTCVYFSARTGTVLKKYHKSHLPGTKEPYADPDAINQLEKRYFEEGQEGFEAFRVPGLLEGTLKKSSQNSESAGKLGRGDPIVGLLICNDRRWAEAWRVYGLQGCELILCGYNTTSWAPHLHGRTGGRSQSKEQSREDAYFHHKLVMQSNSYTNSCFSVCAARCGMDDNEFGLIGGSCIISPDGRIIAEAQSEDDEVVFAEIDLEDCRPGKETVSVSMSYRYEFCADMLALRHSILVDIVDQNSIDCSSSRRASLSRIF